jgi:serine/threonine protein kinase
LIGKQLGPYETEELLGSGGMGVVYRARDVRLGRSVALKVLKQELTTDGDRKKRFLQEARSVSAVTHPAIAQVYDVGEFEGVTYMAMEYVDGRTLREVIARRELDLLAALEIGIQVSEGLAAAHGAGLVHRDIKSENIMVTPSGHAKVLDFGLAKLMDSFLQAPDASGLSEMETMAKTQVGTVLGTIAYMSPEQARGRAVDHRSDLFSMGIVIYEMVTGELPFKGDSPLDTMHAIAFEEVPPVTIVRKNLPPELQRILSRCLRKKPDDRYPDAKSLSNDLKRLKRDIESGLQRPLPLQHRAQYIFDWIRHSVPYGAPGAIAAGAVILLLAYLFVSNINLGSIVLLLLIGLPVYRFIRNRKNRMLKWFVGRVSRIPEVEAVIVRGDLVTVIVNRAQAGTYVRVQGYLDNVNKKLFYGAPVETTVRDDIKGEELRQILREPGVSYVREGILNDGPESRN